MNNSLKIVIPMAGLGTRLRPLTWSKPKQLVSVAGKAVLDHVLDTLASLPDPQNIELVNIVGYLGDQIETHIREKYPQIKAHYVFQDDPRGQSHAIYLAREFLEGPMLMIFADTLIKTDLSVLNDESAQAIAWVKAVPDPRRFGVAEINGHAAQLISAIEEQMRRDIQIDGEYFIADAINIMLEKGLRMSTALVDVWLDAGTPESLLETNRYLLENGMDNSDEASRRPGIVVVPPVFIHPSADVQQSIIGPHTSLGADCLVRSSIIRDSILADAAEVYDAVLEGSLVGSKARIKRRAGVINAGDQTILTF
jgi:glucose-1-phosphate thymidylyltransferase